MTQRAGSSEAMVKARQQASLDKQQRVRDVIERLARDGGPMDVRSVARQAGVSHTFIHSHSELISSLRRARETTAGNPEGVPAARRRAPDESLAADLALARAEIARLREQETRLRRALRHDLGARLEEQDETAMREQLRSRTADLQAVVAERNLLQQQLSDTRWKLQTTEDELTAEREAHARALQMMQMPENVRNIR